MRVTLLHGLQGNQGRVAVAAVHLQLGVAQGNGQLGFGLTLQGTLQQVVTVFGAAQLIGGTRGAEVVQQRLTLGFGSAMQVTLSAGPATLGEVQLALLDGQLRATAAVAPRPGVDHPA
ncbi:hypothetical protein D3C80_1116250 [compost metagenome]